MAARDLTVVPLVILTTDRHIVRLDNVGMACPRALAWFPVHLVVQFRPRTSYAQNSHRDCLITSIGQDWLLYWKQQAWSRARHPKCFKNGRLMLPLKVGRTVCGRRVHCGQGSTASLVQLERE